MSPHSAEQMKSFDKEKQKIIKSDMELYDELKKFSKAVPLKDKYIIQTARKIANRKNYFERYKIEYFREYLSKIKKAEKSVLAAGGFTIDDNIEEVIKFYKKDLEQAKLQMEEIKSEAHRQEIMEEIAEKKKAMQVQGKSIEDRVKDFESLNYLLDYKFTDVDPAVCELPVKGMKVKKQDNQDNDFKFKLELKRKKAKAKLMLA